MKIVIVNGSPRKGNTYSAINALVEGAKDNNDIEVIDSYKLKISPCVACGTCECYKGCVAKDDSNPTVDKLVNADMIIFATPVYWWGITAQIKLVIDKCYCKGALLKNKKVGVIAIGGSPTTNVQYELIEKQFQCIGDYLDWDIKFHKSFFASEKDDLLKNESAMKELKALGKEI